jgi:hypothetical protein
VKVVTDIVGYELIKASKGLFGVVEMQDRIWVESKLLSDLPK